MQIASPIIAGTVPARKRRNKIEREKFGQDSQEEYEVMKAAYRPYRPESGKIHESQSGVIVEDLRGGSLLGTSRNFSVEGPTEVLLL